MHRAPPRVCRLHQEGTKGHVPLPQSCRGPCGEPLLPVCSCRTTPVPSCLEPFPGTEVGRAGLGSPGGQPCGSEHHQEPRSAHQERPSEICQHITSGPRCVSKRPPHTLSTALEACPLPSIHRYLKGPFSGLRILIFELKTRKVKKKEKVNIKKVLTRMKRKLLFGFSCVSIPDYCCL